MSYERQNTVKDGEKIIARNDLDNGSEATKGQLIHGVDHEDKATAISATENKELATADKDVRIIFGLILEELQKINIHLSNITDLDLGE